MIYCNKTYTVCSIGIVFRTLDTNIFTCLSKVMDMEQPPIVTLNASVLPQKNQKKTSTQRLIFIISYFTAIPIFVIFLVLFSLSLKYEGNGYISRQAHKPQYQALPTDNNTSSVELESKDGRVKALDSFFAKYDSPLVGHSKFIIDEADKNKIDYRLIPAIAMQESTLCKKIIKNSHNCWGFGIYGGKVTRFSSYDEAIAKVTSTLAKKYIQKGYVSPSEIVQKYTPGDTGRWPEVVGLMMQHINDSL